MKGSFILSGVAAIFIAILLTSGMLWFFQIPISELEAWKNFPNGWTLLDLIRNAFAVLFFCGSGVTAYKVLRGHV